MTFNPKEPLEAEPRISTTCKTVNDVETPVVTNEEPSKPDGTSSTNSDVSSANFNSAPSACSNPVHLKILTKRFKTNEPLTRIQIGKESTGVEPLILIHDGSGVSTKFQLIRLLDRELWGITNPKIFAEDTWDDLNAMASAYAAKVATTISGPCIIGGWSFGGVVAFRAAQILLANKYPIKGVILLDSPPPLNHQPLPIAIADAIFDSKTPGKRSSDIQEWVHLSIRRQVVLNTAMLASFRPVYEALTPKMVLLRCREGYDTSSLQGEFNAWLSDRSDPRAAVEGWEKVVGAKVDMIDIPGHHFSVFAPENIKEVSDAISRACEIL